MKYFGTDGIRGYINEKITSSLSYKIGCAIGSYITKNKLKNKVLIGKDTRNSCDSILYSLSGALLDYGIDICYIDIVPTACVSYLTSIIDVGMGVMITASHNSYDMNGIKIFNSLGYKLNFEEECEIENFIENPSAITTKNKGNLVKNTNYVNLYINNIISSFKTNLKGLNIAIDCANGSNSVLAGNLYKKLGANLIEISTIYNGFNINDGCGAQFIEHLQKEVVDHNCDIGFAFDGDADRLRVVLKNGTILDGDELLYIFSKYLMKKSLLNSNTVVGTIMTNSGIEKSLNKINIHLERVDVGDKNVIEFLKNKNYTIGGEVSGHICIKNYNTSCDALMNSIFLLKIIKSDNMFVENCLQEMKKTLQKTINIKINKNLRENFDNNIELKDDIHNIINKYKNIKIVIRPSGTEPVIRIMVESDDSLLNDRVINEIKAIFKEKSDI